MSDIATIHEPEHPWERQPDETDAAWQAFTCYLNIGPGRTLDSAWESYKEARGLKTKVRGPHFTAWSREHNWYERATKWDATVHKTGLGDRVDAQRRTSQKFYAALPELLEAALELALGKGGDPPDATMIRFLLDRGLPAKPSSGAGATHIHAQNVQVNQQMVDQLGNDEIMQLLKQSDES